MPSKRDAPCDCGSGLPYRHCHYPIDRAGPQKRLEAARRAYLENWRTNAASYATQGCYTWMAAQLEPFHPRRILDIGCGDGTGILHLARAFGRENGLTLFSTEENHSCIQAARQRLADEGLGVSITRRYEWEVRSPKTHALRTFFGRLPVPHGICLVEGDLIIDEELEDFLAGLEKFDAVTVWLIGTHLVRHECYNLSQLELRETSDYRLWVHRKAYPVADKVLRAGGVLHIVDRGEVPSSELLVDDILAGHRSMAEGMKTSLHVTGCTWMEYSEPDDDRRIAMKPTPGASGRMADLSKLAMRSVLAVKP